MPYIGNAVIQGVDWVAFQCLWPCEYAAAGKPCEFCFSGAEFQSCAIKNKPMPRVPSPEDVGEIVGYAMSKAGCNSVQITGGSTFQSEVEEKYITSYLEAIERIAGHDAVTGELLLYITPPDQTNVIDRYFQLGANRIACSLEIWDEERAKIITPGKIAYTTRERHLSALSYIAERYGPAKAFSNLIIGIEDFDTLQTGATYLAQRGILPTASIWMPFGRPVMGNMQAPGVDYYRRVKELFAELYTRYQLEPPATRGLNVCMERDIWRYAQNVPVH